MFRLSFGTYLVYCVASMICNYGIIKQGRIKDIAPLYKDAFWIYNENLGLAPHSPKIRTFRDKYS